MRKEQYPQKDICLTTPVGSDVPKQPRFLLLVGMPLELRVRLFFLTKELCCSPSRMIREFEKRWEGPVLDGPRVIGIEF